MPSFISLWARGQLGRACYGACYGALDAVGLGGGIPQSESPWTGLGSALPGPTRAEAALGEHCPRVVAGFLGLSLCLARVSRGSLIPSPAVLAGAGQRWPGGLLWHRAGPSARTGGEGP